MSNIFHALVFTFAILCECVCPPPSDPPADPPPPPPPPPPAHECEATGEGRCYYIAPTGSDETGDGSEANPWRTYLPIVSRYGDDPRPSYAVDLSEGDVVYFAPGSYKANYTYNGHNKALYLRFVHGVTFKGLDGQAVIDGSGCTKQKPCSAIEVESSSNLTFENIRTNGAYAVEGGGFRCDGTTNLNLYKFEASDNHGDEANNAAGFSARDCRQVTVKESVFRDNFELGPPSGGNDENDANIVLFGGASYLFEYVTVGNTAPVTDTSNRGGCLKFKHMCTGAPEETCLEVRYSTFDNCAHAAIGLNTPRAHIHHNTIRNSEVGVYVKDWGGAPRQFADITIERNDFENAHAFQYDPGTGSELGPVIFRRNKVLDHATSYGNERGLLTVDPYGSNTRFNALRNVTSRFQTNENCYHNSNGLAPKFAFFAAAGSYGASGAVYNLSTWQSMGYDTQSVFGDASCVGYGRFGE